MWTGKTTNESCEAIQYNGHNHGEIVQFVGSVGPNSGLDTGWGEPVFEGRVVCRGDWIVRVSGGAVAYVPKRAFKLLFKMTEVDDTEPN